MQTRINPATTNGSRELRERLSHQLGLTPTSTSDDRSPLTSDCEVIVVQAGHHWRYALEAALQASTTHPDLLPRIHLFGELPLPLEEIILRCEPFGVRVTWEP